MQPSFFDRLMGSPITVQPSASSRIHAIRDHIGTILSTREASSPSAPSCGALVEAWSHAHDFAAVVRRVERELEKNLIRFESRISGIRVTHVPGRTPGEVALVFQIRGLLAGTTEPACFIAEI